MKSKALVILSGGMDSTICLYLAKREFEEVHAITFDYGQTHKTEIEAAKKIASLAGVNSHDIVTIPNILKSKSPLVNNHNAEQYADYESMIKEVGDRRERTFVEMRNGLFLTIAANAASFLDLSDIYIGVCEADTANYTDCTSEFLDSAQDYINKSLGIKGTDFYRIRSPLISLKKHDSILLASTMPDCWEALAYTHTSYDGEYPPVNHNHANLLRAKSFELAGLPDPLILRAYKEGLMELPKTSNYEGV